MRPMVRMILIRLGLGFLSLFVVSIVVFGAVDLLPGDVAEEILGQNRTPEAVAAIRRDLGLDRPLAERYAGWIGGALTG